MKLRDENLLFVSFKRQLKITPTCFGSCAIHHQGVLSCDGLKLLLMVHRYFFVCLVGVWKRNFEPAVSVHSSAHTPTHRPSTRKISLNH